MSVKYTIMGIIGKFTPLNSSSFNAALDYQVNFSDNFSSRDMAGMSSSSNLKASALGLASGIIKKGTGYFNVDSIKDRIYARLSKVKGNYLFVVTMGLRNTDNAPTRILNISKINTATPQSKARFMHLVDMKCKSGKISCVSIPPLTKAMHNIRIYIIASVR